MLQCLCRWKDVWLLNWYILTVFDRDDFNCELFTVYEIIKRAKSSNSSGFMKFWDSC
jgi:hypothetical protein